MVCEGLIVKCIDIFCVGYGCDCDRCVVVLVWCIFNVWVLFFLNVYGVDLLINVGVCC